MDDDDKMTLRDKFAIEVLHSLLEGRNSGYNFVQNPNKQGEIENIEKYIRGAYKIADLMRKVRLTPFD